MSAATLTATATADAHRAFDAALGRIDAALRYHFRRWPRADREDAIAEARAYTWAAWLGLIRRGKDPVAVGVVAIAANCCRAVKNGRSVAATRSPGRGAMDVHHPGARRATGLRVVPLEELAGLPPGGLAGLARLATTATARPTRRPSASTSPPGWTACRRGSGAPPSCWPRGSAPARWPAASG